MLINWRWTQPGITKNIPNCWNHDAFYVEKICTNLHRSIKSDGMSPLHPYYSRDYRSTSHIKASLAKDRCFSRGLGMWFQVFLRSQEWFSNSWKIMMFHHVWVQKKSSISQTLWLLRTRLIFYENQWYFNQMNPQDVFYMGKIPTDYVELNQ